MAIFSTLKKAMDRHYDAQAAANCNTCSVGTWVVCHENHLLKQSGGYSMKAFFKRLAGSRNTAAVETTTVSKATCGEREQCKILIVCKGYAFSRGIADYAINMAKKTRSSLVALNIDELGRDFTGFQDKAKKEIEYFSCRAADAGIAFEHEIRQGDEATVVDQIHESDPRFRYVMDDTAVVCKSRGSIPVYTRATMRAK